MFHNNGDWYNIMSIDKSTCISTHFYTTYTLLYTSFSLHYKKYVLKHYKPLNNFKLILYTIQNIHTKQNKYKDSKMPVVVGSYRFYRKFTRDY